MLVADDDPIQRDLLEIALTDWGYDVLCVENGIHAWEQLQQDSEYSILITDWLMPELDGVDLCRRVRAARRARYLPIILLTSRDRRVDQLEALDSGADAFLAKPFDPPQLLAQIHVAERILKLEERLARKLADLRVAHEKLENDLAAAARVQSSLLPHNSPNFCGVEFAWVYQACEQLGGDMFNIFRLDERQLGMYVLDVSGHGTSAALQSVSLSHVLTPFDQQGGILKRITGESARGYSVMSPARVARELNAGFQLIEQSGQFVTFLYGILDIETLVLRYVCAGHPGPILLSGQSVRCFEKCGGIPIGIMPDTVYEEGKIQLSRGDRLIFYTDGVLDARSEEGEVFGFDRLVHALADSQCGIEETLGSLRDRIERFRGRASRRDDITMVGLEVD